MSNGKRPHRRVFRNWMIRRLGATSKKWKLLSYPEFCIKAYKKVNPDKSKNPYKNFSELEAIAGYVQKFEDVVILVLDKLGRPDLYIRHQYRGERKAWNHDPANTVGQIDIIPRIVPEYEHPRTHQRYKKPKEVYNDFVEILEGSEAVSIVDNHLGNCSAGIDGTRAIKGESRDIRRVERYVDQLLAEFARRHGRSP